MSTPAIFKSVPFELLSGVDSPANDYTSQVVALPAGCTVVGFQTNVVTPGTICNIAGEFSMDGANFTNLATICNDPGGMFFPALDIAGALFARVRFMDACDCDGVTVLITAQAYQFAYNLPGPGLLTVSKTFNGTEIGVGIDDVIVPAPGLGKVAVPVAGSVEFKTGTIPFVPNMQILIRQTLVLYNTNTINFQQLTSAFNPLIQKTSVGDQTLEESENLPLDVVASGFGGYGPADTAVPDGGINELNIVGEQITVAIDSYSIITVLQGTKTFEFSSDVSNEPSVQNCPYLVISGSTGNDGTYTIASISGAEVEVNEAIPDPTPDGTAYFCAGILEVATVTNPAFAVVTSVNQPARAITGLSIGVSESVVTVAGDHVSEFNFPSLGFRIAGSTGNDDYYTILSAVLNGGNTDITTNSVLPDPTADGTIQGPDYVTVSGDQTAFLISGDLVNWFKCADPGENGNGICSSVFSGGVTKCYLETVGGNYTGGYIGDSTNGLGAIGVATELSIIQNYDWFFTDNHNARLFDSRYDSIYDTPAVSINNSLSILSNGELKVTLLYYIMDLIP